MEFSVQPVSLSLSLDAGAGADLEVLDRLTRQLFSELQDLEVESVELVKSGERLPGTKSVDPVTIGALAVSVLPTVAPKVIEFLQSWVLRSQNHTVKIKAQVQDRSIEVEYNPSAMSQAELQKLMKVLTGAIPPAAKG